MKYIFIKKEDKEKKKLPFENLRTGDIFRLRTSSPAFVYMKVDCHCGEEVSNAIRMIDGKLFYFDLSEPVYFYNGFVEFDEDGFTDTLEEKWNFVNLDLGKNSN